MTIVATGGQSMASSPKRDWRRSVWRGFLRSCPSCGKGNIFCSYLKVGEACLVCGEDFSYQRADDAPAYLTMMIVGHLLIVGVAMLEDTWALSTGVQLAIWLPLATVMTLWLLPRIKGSVVALQWAFRMHGF